MKELKEGVLQYVKANGPVLPVEVARYVKNEVMLTSAILAELVSEKIVNISKAKIGGSPVYYVPGQEIRLSRLYEYLGEKPKRAYSLLREKRVLRDKILEPWQRVALRELQDFAKRIDVKIGDGTEIFWKWYLTSDEDAKREIVRIVKGDSVPIQPKKEPVEEKKEIVKEEIKSVEPVKKEKPKVKEFILGQKAKSYFEQNNLNIISADVIKKNKEVNYIAEVNSDLGKLIFFVKLLDKKKVNEGDLSLAISKAKGKPVLFLSSGELTKKAQKYFEDNLKGRFIFKSL